MFSDFKIRTIISVLLMAFLNFSRNGPDGNIFSLPKKYDKNGIDEKNAGLIKIFVRNCGVIEI